MAAVTVYTVWPITEWDTQVPGVPTIFISGTTFDDTLLAAVQTAATNLGVALSVNTEPGYTANETLTKTQADQLYEPVGGGGGGGGTGDATSINGVTINGTPSSTHQVLTSLSPTLADWEAPTLNGVTVSNAPIAPFGQVLTATSATGASWQNVTATTINSVAISGTAPTADQVLTASDGTHAAWATPTVGGATVTNSPALGLVLAATSSNQAQWSVVSATSLAGVAISGTPTTGQVLTATAGSPNPAADWQTPTATSVSGVAVSATLPTGSGQVLTSTATNAAHWANVTANSLGGVVVSGTPTVGQVLTATAGSPNPAASWAPSPNASYTIATGLSSAATAAAASANVTYLQGLINTLGNPTTGTGGFIWIPPANNPYLLNAQIEMLDHVFIVGMGYDWMKNQTAANQTGASTTSPAACTFKAYTDTTNGFPTSPAAAMFHFNNNGGMINCSVQASAAVTTSKGCAPVAIWVSGAGNIFQNVKTDGGYLGFFIDNNGPTGSAGTPPGDEGIDNNLYNVYMTQNANGGTLNYATAVTASVSTGDTITVASGTGIHPGMAVIDLTNPGSLQHDTIVYSKSGTTITLTSGYGQTQNAVKSQLFNAGVGDVLLFVSSAAGLVCSSDMMIHGLRSITGTYICAGADTMHIGCHFSTGGNAGVYNVINNAGQGGTWSGCTFDNGNNGAGSAGHVLQVSGGFLETGGRIQSGITTGLPFPHIHDICSGSGNKLISSCHVPAIGTALDALVAFSPAVWDQGTNTWVGTGNTAAVSSLTSYTRVMIEGGAIGTVSGTPRFVTRNTGTGATGHPSNGTVQSATGPYHDASVGSTLYTV